MRKSAIVNLNSSKLLVSLKRNYLIIILFIVFIFGIATGTFLLSKNSELSAIALNMFSEFLSERQSTGFFKIFSTSFFDILPFWLIIFLCGTSMAGVVLIPITLAFKGLSFGIISGYLYSAYLLKGIAFNALFLIPLNLIIAFALIISGRISFEYSLVLIKASIPNGQMVNLYNYFQSYCKKFLISMLFFIISALLDALMSVGFMNLFTF